MSDNDQIGIPPIAAACIRDMEYFVGQLSYERMQAEGNALRSQVDSAEAQCNLWRDHHPSWALDPRVTARGSGLESALRERISFFRRHFG